MRSLRLGLTIALLIALPALGRAQSTDRSEMDQWVKDTANQGTVPTSGTVTMSNWQQYKQFMPLGMQKLFEGTYFWKMPPDVQINIAPAKYDFLPQTWISATEQYGSQTSVKVLPNGHYEIENYHGGTPFPNPQDPYKGWKILANVFWAYQPSVVVKTPDNYGSVWAVDRYGNVNVTTLDLVYRWSDFITDPGFPKTMDYAPGTWYTEWGMEETPEQARYTASLQLFYVDQEAHPFPDTFVFVPALRRSLRLSSTARCSPVYGFDWTYDDAKTNGFNGNTAVYNGDFLGDREILTLAHFNNNGGKFPDNYDMPLGFPKPSWGNWEIRHMAVDDVHRIPSEAAGYCYSSRIIYADKEHWNGDWVDLYDSNRKLWKSIAYYNGAGVIPGLGQSWTTVSSMAMDFQNSHETIWSDYGNPKQTGFYFDHNAPAQYLDGVKYGSPGGLMMIER
ncbi:MAG TPA: DUF1329 domain-containing protein [Candidatus Binataceae bacterium]|nr:DUF1329 domain-containing protein [Candidatus Binataceae bacterium]